MTFRNKLIAGLASAFAFLLLVAVLAYMSSARDENDRQWVTHTRQVIEKLDEVLVNVVDAETGQRGYILTGEDAYLEPYSRAVSQLGHAVKEVRVLTSDNSNQQRALDQLEPLLEARLSELREHLRARKELGLGAAAESVRGSLAKEHMEQIRVVIGGMKAEEERLLVLRAEALAASSRTTRVIIIIGEATGFLLLFLAGLVIQQEMKQRARVEEEVRRLNADLEMRVAERTSELAERAKDLERSNMELQQFAYVASHDLQEPLRTISSFTQLLAKRYQEKLDDKAQEFIGFAVDGCKRMQTLINDLLSFSRVGTQGKPLVPVSCDAVVERVLKSLRVAIGESGAVITRDSLPVVLADEIQLGQLFQNLIGNAVKFRTKDTPQIQISAERNGGGWKISVRDNGIGIAPEHSDRIFVIFQRLHTKTQYPGTGIGLAMCKKIAERHGGRIWVEPSTGGGSVFYFTIGDGETTNAKERDSHELRLTTAIN